MLSSRTYPKSTYLFKSQVLIIVCYFTSLEGNDNSVLLYLAQNDSVIDIKGSQFVWQGKITVFLKAVLVLRLTQVSNKNTELCYQKRLEELQPGTNKLVHLTVNVEMGFPKLN